MPQQPPNATNPPAPSEGETPRKSPLKKIASLAIKVAIAVVGLWWVISHTPWSDQATIARGSRINEVEFLDPTPVAILDATADREKNFGPLPATAWLVRFGARKVHVRVDGHEVWAAVTDPPIGWDTSDRVIAKEFCEQMPGTHEPMRVVGLKNLIKGANRGLLLASWALLVIPFLVSAWRWRKLMEPQGIKMPFKQVLALTFVGQFYSTFLPGVTTGDLVKIIYTSRLTGSKTKSTVTVLLDRVIGLVALIVIAGVAALCQLRTNPTMGRVAGFAGLAIIGLFLGCLVYFSHRLRKATGLAWLLNHSAMPDFVRGADEVLHLYRGHTGVLVEAFAISLITQIVVPISAYLAGKAFGIEAHPGYYLAYVPLAVLAQSVPISFLGLGVMDSVLFNFFFAEGLATGSQTFALAQAIRFLPVLWNMVGAYWVVKGKFSRHQAMEEERAMTNDK